MTEAKEYSPQSHGDTEKSKLKGKTGAHGGGGGHGENPRGAQRFSALVVQRRGEKQEPKSKPEDTEAAEATEAGIVGSQRRGSFGSVLSSAALRLGEKLFLFFSHRGAEVTENTKKELTDSMPPVARPPPFAAVRWA